VPGVIEVTSRGRSETKEVAVALSTVSGSPASVTATAESPAHRKLTPWTNSRLSTASALLISN
jgi:hypothetical protein